MEFLGLDIGSKSIKAVQLSGSSSSKRLVAYSSVGLEKEILSGDEEKAEELDAEALRQPLKKLISSGGFTTRNAVVSLPESKIFTRVIQMPKMSKKELSTAIRFEAEQYIPVSLDDVTMDWDFLPDSSATKDGKISVLLVAAPKKLISNIVEVLKKSGITAVAIESETISIVRSVVGDDTNLPTTMIISIGASTTDLTIVKSGSVRFTRSIGTGGEALTRAISQNLNLGYEQAEEYKRSYGLDKSQADGEIAKVLTPVFNVILNDVRRALSFYKSRHPHDDVKRVILVGGSAALPGATGFLAEALGIEIQLGNPWDSIEIPGSFNRQDVEEKGPSYAVAVGLALKKV